MKKLLNFLANFKFIFMPHYWIMDDTFDAAWDKKFRELAETHDFVPDCKIGREFGNKTHTAFLGDYRVWTSNYPFAFFTFCGKKGEMYDMSQARPSRLAIAKYYKKLKTDLAKYNCKHSGG